jgi:hypothetical protein
MLTKLNFVAKWAVYLYAVSAIVLETTDYFLTGSRFALAFGALLGLMLLLSLLSKKSGFAALILIVFLTLLAGYRYLSADSLPSALLAVLGGGILIVLLAQMARWK